MNILKYGFLSRCLVALNVVAVVVFAAIVVVVVFAVVEKFFKPF